MCVLSYDPFFSYHFHILFPTPRPYHSPSPISPEPCPVLTVPPLPPPFLLSPQPLVIKQAPLTPPWRETATGTRCSCSTPRALGPSSCRRSVLLASPPYTPHLAWEHCRALEKGRAAGKRARGEVSREAERIRGETGGTRYPEEFTGSNEVDYV